MSDKQARRIGADGKLYFTYNLKAEYEMRPPFSTPFNYRVIGVEFDEPTETEYYRIESAGEELPARFPLRSLKYFSRSSRTQRLPRANPSSFLCSWKKSKPFMRRNVRRQKRRTCARTRN